MNADPRQCPARPHSLVAGATCALVFALAAPILGAGPARAAPGGISTLAGGGIGDDGPATSAVLRSPAGVDVDHSGNVFIGDDHDFRVRKVAANGVITTVAGTGARASSGDGGPATSASFIDVGAVAVDGTGRLYIVDQDRIRRVDTNGIITTFAGGGDGPLADGVPATSTSLGAQGIALDPAGNLFVSGIDHVFRVDTNGILTVLAGGGSPADGLGDGGLGTDAVINNPPGITLDAADDVFISDGSQRIRRIDQATKVITTVAGDGNFGFAGDGGPAVNAEVAGPVGLDFDPAGGLLIADKNNQRVRRIDADGIINTVAGSDSEPGFSGDGGPAVAARLGAPYSLAADTFGNYWFVDAQNDRVRKVDTNGIITTIAGGGVGDGGPATAAPIVVPTGVRAAAGSTFVSSRGSDASSNRVRRVNPAGIISTVAGGGQPSDRLGDNGPATAAQLNSPIGLALTPSADTMFIADCGNNRVRKVDSNGVITTYAGGGKLGDGRRATLAALQCPTGLLLVTGGMSPKVGTLFIADCDANRVRKVDNHGIITTVAGTGTPGFNGDGLAATATQLSCPSDLALDGSGRLLIADKGANRVRRIETSGAVSTVAGDGGNGFGSDDGPATATHVNNPSGLALDSSGRLLVVENSHARIRRIDTHGVISTVAGNGVPGFSGDGGPATLANLSGPTQVALDRPGNMVFTDTFNQRVRRVAKGTSSFPTSGCGAVVTANTTLTSDIGPCPGDGLLVGADNITIDLGGHTVAGRGPGAGDGSHVGIRLAQRHGVTLANGNVSGFDAGIALIAASGNTVKGLHVIGNVAPLNTPAGFESSEFGDGVVLMFSSANKILNNVIDGNGIYDNIGLLGLGTDDNLIKGNRVTDAVGDGRTGGFAVGLGITISPFLDLNLPARGNSLHGNDVVANVVSGNYTSGISMLSNDHATVARNTVTGNGLSNPVPGNGIGIRNTALANPLTDDLVIGNKVHGNARNGIQVTSHQNRITDNDAADNAALGVGGFDLDDESFYRDPFRQQCTDNVWTGNIWGAGGFNQVCTTTAGHPAGGVDAVPAVAWDKTASPDAVTDAAHPEAQEATGGQRHLSPVDLALGSAAAGGR